MLSFLRQRFRFGRLVQTTHALSTGLERHNGRVIFKSPWQEATAVNGQAIVGSEAFIMRTEKLLVVHGELKARNTEFFDLETNGSVRLFNCILRGSTELFGGVRVYGCVLHQLELYGTVFYFEDTVIHGPVRVRSPFKMRPQIVLRDSSIKGEVVFEKGVGGTIKVRP